MFSSPEDAAQVPSMMASLVGADRLMKMDEREAAIIWAAIEDEVNSNSEIRRIIAEKVESVINELR